MKGAWQLLDYDVAADLWSRCAPTRWNLSAKRIKAQIADSPLLDLDASHWRTTSGKLTGFISILRSANPSLYAGPDPTQAHVNLMGFQDFQVAKEMLEESSSVLRAKGVTKLLFGADSRHFFPGCPKDWELLESFLRDCGFEGSNEFFDLERDLAGYEAPVGHLDPIALPYSARPCLAADLPSLTEFFDSTFPNRWKTDVLMKWNLEGPETVMGLFDGDRMVGFALIQRDGCQRPIDGAVWESDLGAGWGSLGPIGIMEEVRGKGLGSAILAASLVELRNRGARRTIIHWTTLDKYYGAQGFEITRRYVSLAKPL